jgi:hypothetical protein
LILLNDRSSRLDGGDGGKRKQRCFDKKIIVDLKNSDRITEGADFLCSSPSPYEQKDFYSLCPPCLCGEKYTAYT